MALRTQTFQAAASGGSAVGCTAASGSDYSVNWYNGSDPQIAHLISDVRYGAFVVIDTSDIPAGSTIASAILSFTPRVTSALNGTNCQVRMVDSYTGDCSTNWGNPFVSLDPDFERSWTGPQNGWTAETRNANSEVDVTTMVQAAVNASAYGGAGNSQLHIWAISSTANNVTVMAYSSATTYAKGPRLTISWTPPDDGLQLSFNTFEKRLISNSLIV